MPTHLDSQESDAPHHVGVDRRGFLAGALATAATASSVTALPSPLDTTSAALAKAARKSTATDPADLTIAEAIGLLKARRLSSRELTEACLRRIDERDGELTAWERVYREDAVAMAAAADRRLARGGARSGRAPLLCGVPVGVKDIIAIGGRPLTASSRALEGNIAPSDSHAWERLQAQGMVLLGHTRTQEFATGNNPQNAGNPWDPRRSPGGSSSGSGAAVGGRQVPVGLGTDAGGSLRRPASACNLTTIMGTYGRVSTRGIVTANRSVDHVGPLVRSAVDASLMLGVLAGRDPLDPSTYAAPAPPESFPLTPRRGSRPFAGMRFALTPEHPAMRALSPGVAGVYERFVNELRALGAELVAIAIPPAPPTPAPAPEAVLLHRDLFQAKGHLYSPPMREQVAAQQANAGSVTALALYEAQVRRGQWIRDLQQLLADRRVDVIVQPSQNLETPLRRGSDEAGDVGRFGDSALRGLWNSAGFPAMSVPGGLSAETGLPVGMQFIGAPWTDASLLQVAVDYQARTEHHTLAPERWS